MSTIKHVTARAGASFTTISHVLNGTHRVSETAAGVLIERIAAGAAACRAVVLAPQLLMRESTGAVPVR